MADSAIQVDSPIRSSGSAYLTRDIAFRSFSNMFSTEGSLNTVRGGSQLLPSHNVTANSTPNSGIVISSGVSIMNIKLGTDSLNNNDLYARVPFETIDNCRDLTLSNCPVAFGRRDLVCIRYVFTDSLASAKIVTVEGTASASPLYPTLPNDGNGTFYLPLAGISRVANASTVQASDIVTTGLTNRATPALTINSILWQSNNIVRYTFSGSPDISAISQGDSLVVTGATSAVNNGTYIILNTNNVNDYVEVINMAVSSNATNQVSVGGTATREENLRKSALISAQSINNDIFLAAAGGTMTGKLQFSGTNHAGLRLNNLTTAQRNALTAQNGDVIYNTASGVIETFGAAGWSSNLSQKQINATKIFVEQNFL